MYCVPQGTLAGNHYGAYKKALYGIIGKGDILVIIPFSSCLRSVREIYHAREISIDMHTMVL